QWPTPCSVLPRPEPPGLAAHRGASQLPGLREERRPMFDHETTAADVMTDAALGAIAGVAVTAAMEPLTAYLSKRQPKAAKRREKEVDERLGSSPTVNVVEKAVSTLGKSLPAHRHSLAGKVVHYGFGTFWGAALGALSAGWKPLPPGAGAAL